MKTAAMDTNRVDIVRSLAAIQTELRTLPMAGDGGALSTSPPGNNPFTGFLAGAAGTALRGIVFGCRLFHWNPELENFLVDVIRHDKPVSFKVYFPLDRRVGSKSHVFFAKLYKSKYGPAVERQFGITYSDFQPKSEVQPLLEAFKDSATRAGALVGAAKAHLTAVLPAETLTARQDLHRWLFTVFDIAWKKSSGSPLTATRYIPMEGLDPFMRTDESLIYDLAYIRSTPWSTVEPHFDKNKWGYFAHFKEPYASWSEQLPVYYASRIDDIVQASDWAIDWLVKQLEEHSNNKQPSDGQSAN